MQIQGNIPIKQLTGNDRTGRETPLGEGDVLRGEVIGVSPGLVTLRLEGGGVLRAQVGGDVAMALGQQVELTVTGAEGDRIVMRLTQGQEPGITLTANLPELTQEQRQAAVVYSLMRHYGIAPTKESFARVTALMESFPEMDARTAVFLAANVRQIPEGGQDASLRALVGALMQPGVDGIAQPLQALMEALSFEAGGAGASQSLADLFLPQEAIAAPAQRGEPSAILPREGAQAVAKYLMQAAPEGFRYIAASGRLADAAAMLRTASGLPSEAALQLLEAFAADVAPQGMPAPADLMPALARALLQLAGQPAGGAAPAFSLANAAPQATPEQAAALLEALAPQRESAVTPQAPAPQGGTAVAAAVQENAGQAANVQQQVTAQQAVNPPLDVAIPPGVQAGGEPAQAGATAARLAELADSLFAQMPREAGEAGAELRRVTQMLLSGLSRLREGTEALPGRGAAATVAYQVEARAQALPQITQFHYMQIPVQLYDRRQSADLYVMRRPGRRPQDGEECTILIALDTEHLGRVEAVVRAVEKDVSITFRMRPGGAAEAVRGSFPELSDAVAQAGYRLREAIIAAQDEPVAPQTFAALMDELFGAQTALDIQV